LFRQNFNGFFCNTSDCTERYDDNISVFYADFLITDELFFGFFVFFFIFPIDIRVTRESIVMNINVPLMLLKKREYNMNWKQTKNASAGNSGNSSNNNTLIDLFKKLESNDLDENSIYELVEQLRQRYPRSESIEKMSDALGLEQKKQRKEKRQKK